MRVLMNGSRILLACLFVAACATAQTTSIVDGTLPLGVGPAASYPLSGLEHYDPFSGSLNPSLPLHHIGGRGEAGFDLVWNLQQTWIAAKRFGGSNPFIPVDPYPDANVEGPQGVAGPLGAGAVFSRTGSAFTACNSGSVVSSTLARIVFESPGGEQIEFVDQNTNGAVNTIQDPCSQTQTNPYDRGKVFTSTDGSALVFVSDSDILDNVSPGFGEADVKVSGYLNFPSGVTYRVDSSDISWIRDRNGNKIALQYSSNQVIAVTWYLSVDAPSQIIDSLGRVTTINYGDASCGGCTTITYSGAGGAQRVVQIVQSHLSTSGVLRGDYPSVETLDQLFPNTGQPTSYNFDPVLASYIQLPDGNRFTFQYDPYGELARVTLPTGGALEYDYGDGNNGSTDGFVGVTTDSNPVMIYRRLQTRREYANGGSGPYFTSRTSYTVSYDSGGNVIPTESILTPSGATLSHNDTHAARIADGRRKLKDERHLL